MSTIFFAAVWFSAAAGASAASSAWPAASTQPQIANNGQQVRRMEESLSTTGDARYSSSIFNSEFRQSPIREELRIAESGLPIEEGGQVTRRQRVRSLCLGNESMTPDGQVHL